MKNNIIEFDRTRKPARATHISKSAGGYHDNVVSLDGWKNTSRTRRTASGVFFTTGVLCTLGAVA